MGKPFSKGNSMFTKQVSVATGNELNYKPGGGECRFRISGALQQHDIGPESVEGGHEAGGAAGAVVANAEQVGGVGHGWRANAKNSPQCYTVWLVELTS